jgi:hypothetical protein
LRGTAGLAEQASGATAEQIVAPRDVACMPEYGDAEDLREWARMEDAVVPCDVRRGGAGPEPDQNKAIDKKVRAR